MSICCCCVWSRSSMKFSSVLPVMSMALAFSTVGAFIQRAPRVAARQLVTMAGSFYDIVEKDAAGKDVSFNKFKGKVVYGVNVASRCGYTASNYNLLKKLSSVQGLELALFPCNQFGGQEPGSDSDVNQFCVAKGVEGPNVNLFTKADVNGPRTRPTYKVVKEATGMAEIGWNFAGKFLVDKKGKVMPVNQSTLEQDIQSLLAQ